MEGDTRFVDGCGLSGRFLVVVMESGRVTPDYGMDDTLCNAWFQVQNGWMSSSCVGIRKTGDEHS